MQSMDVEIMPIAREDIDKALTYIATEDPTAADDLLDRILARLRQAAEFPQSGEEITIGGRWKRKYYQLYARPYRIFYRVEKDRVLVMRVLHERMDTRTRL